MAFDECTPYPASQAQAEESMHLSMRWAERSKESHQGNPNALFGIIQGGMYEDLRAESLEKLISLDENMEFHKKFFKDVKNFINENSSIILVENCAGVTADDIIEMTKDDFKVELIEYDKYGWEGESTFYTIILYLLPNN